MRGARDTEKSRRTSNTEMTLDGALPALSAERFDWRGVGEKADRCTEKSRVRRPAFRLPVTRPGWPRAVPFDWRGVREIVGRRTADKVKAGSIARLFYRP